MAVPRKPSFLPWMALALASALVVLLAAQNRVLDREVRELRVRSAVLQPGSFVPPFQAATSEGGSVRIGEPAAGTRQVLFILNTTCEFCEATLPAWNEIAAALQEAETSLARAYAITLDPPDLTAVYAAARGFEIPWVAFPDRRMKQLYRAGRVPLTVVVDEHGEVHHARVGLIDGRAAIDSVLDAAGGATALAYPERTPARSGPEYTP